MPSLADRYRPSSWADVVAQPKAIAQIDLLRRSGLGGRAFLISGNPGQGKTSIGLLIAVEVTGGDSCGVLPIKASQLTPSKIDDLERKVNSKTLFGTGWAIIINELHGLSEAAMVALHDVLERVPSHVVWIFTTTSDGKQQRFDESIEESPFLSRCQQIELNRRPGSLVIAHHVRGIAIAHNLDGGKPIEWFDRLVKDSANNIRECLQQIEKGRAIDAISKAA